MNQLFKRININNNKTTIQNIIYKSFIPKNSNNSNLSLNNSNKRLFSTSNNNIDKKRNLIKEKVKDIPNLNEFLKSSINSEEITTINNNNNNNVEQQYELPEYLKPIIKRDTGRNVWIETYGCQMNNSDTEIVHSILETSGYRISSDFQSADIVFLNTCSIRENAEAKIWLRLSELRAIRKKEGRQLVVGVLGCMAERLKQKLLESDMKVDIVVGPDAYRSLPSLLHVIEDGEQQTAINVMLSADETYADIKPVRKSDNQVSAYVSIMRGCNNMCAFCIVPFTRGRERSRPVDSILAEVKELSKQGYKEITLLGQNVNSFNYLPNEQLDNDDQQDSSSLKPRDGFTTKYKSPKKGITFTKLIELVADVDPEIRIRFTSPHPKDFPNDLLELIKIKPNICKQLHIPAQSGNNSVLESMKRGYTRETYIELIDTIKRVLPGCTISSDFISGFCGETHQHHLDTISLMEYVGYENAFMFQYSMREKTHAYRHLADDVSQQDKSSRLTSVVDTFYRCLKEKNLQEIGNTHLVLIDGKSRRSENDWIGRTDTNKKVVISADSLANNDFGDPLKVGDYLIVKIVNGDSFVTLKGVPIIKSSIYHWNNIYNKEIN